jgi:hypothetical protein
MTRQLSVLVAAAIPLRKLYVPLPNKVKKSCAKSFAFCTFQSFRRTFSSTSDATIGRFQIYILPQLLRVSVQDI